jgi:MYXO-CTERM domain-containing protein
MKRLLVAASLFVCATAFAHGGLPVSEAILRQNGGDQMFIPVFYWGVWVGQPGQPWKWICEEMINGLRTRRMALSTDGAYYATDAKGLTLSTDNGCTWTAATGEVSTKHMTDVVVHPTDGLTAFATSGDSGGPAPDGGMLPADNALYVTHDHGANFSRVPGLAAENTRLFQGVRVAPSNPMVIYVTSVQPGVALAPSLHRSDDGGNTFNTYPVSYTLMGATPSTVEPFFVDPRDPHVVYLRASTTVPDPDGGIIARQALLRSTDGGMTLIETLTIDGQVLPSGYAKGIDGMTIDAASGRVFVATAQGVYAGDDPGPGPTVTLAPTGNLSQAQCVDVHGGVVYACSNNYAPDNAALAQSTDNGATFSTVFRYFDTYGPVDCPASTPVGMYCPYYWQMYGSMLGIDVNDAGMSVFDGGGGGGGGGGCSCDFAPGGLSGGAVLLLLVAVALIARRRRATSSS